MLISEKDLFNARVAWGDGIVNISKSYRDFGIQRAIQCAVTMLDKLYGFDIGPVLFKPTLSGGVQTFRPTKDGALSYFVGQNPKYPLDTGFGIKNWQEVTSETSAFFIDENIAMWMGWVSLTDETGGVTKVDKSWGYKRDKDGNLKIMLQHSSLPYEPCG